MLNDDKGIEVELIRIAGHEQKKVTDIVAKEIFLNIYVNQEYLVSLNCSPGNLKYLATGFLFSTGIVKDRKEIISIKEVKKGIYFEINNQKLLSGIISSINLISQSNPQIFKKRKLFFLKDEPKIHINTIFLLVSNIQKKAVFFKSSGGVHSCGLADVNGSILLFCEDIGRYNTVDRILGEALFFKNIKIDDKVILTSCRITSGIIKKIVYADIPIIISRAAVTDCAIQLAERQGITLIGFVRGERMNVYTYPERIIS